MADRLDAELWFLELSELLETCEVADVCDQERILYQLHALILVAPNEWSHLFEPRPSRLLLDGFIESSAYLDGADYLLGKRIGFILSRPIQGQSLASIILPDNEGEMHARGNTPAIALVAALASSIFCVVGTEVQLGRSLARRDLG